MRVFEIPASCTSLNGLRRSERADPRPTSNEVLIRTRAASLNSRDQAILNGKYFTGAVQRDLIPLSDGVGNVVSVGAKVTKFRPGDRVAGAFFQNWIDGPPPKIRSALGNPLDGMLAEYVVLLEDGVVTIPDSMSFEEASTLPCAALTAWNALMSTGQPIRKGDTVLCLGTGGVSMAALVFAKSVGARVIVTSSSDDKIAKACSLGAEYGINYRQCQEWGKELQAFGINHVVELGGAGTLRKSLQAVAPGGKITLIGALTGLTGSLNLLDLLSKNASLHGVSVGPRRLFEEMNRAISINPIRPIIDRVFPFEEAVEAFRYHAAGTFVGKVVITF